LVQLYFVLNKFKEVIPYTERQVAIDPSDLNMKVKLGILYTDAQRYEDAKGVFKEILISVPASDKVLYYLGALYQQTNDTEEAIQYFTKIPEESNLFHDGQVQIGRILQAKTLENPDKTPESNDQLDRFEEFVSQASKKDDGLKIELSLMLAITFDQLNNVNKALQLVQDIEKLDGLNEKQIYYLASLYEKQKQYDHSYELISRILKENPENADALNFLGYSYLERNVKLEEAFELISKAHKIKPDDGYIVDSIGWYYFKKGDLDQALFYIQKAYSLIKDDAEILKHLALVHSALNNPGEAKKYLTEAMKFCEEDQKQDMQRILSDMESKPRLPASSSSN
jgi:tetratricopeptide (TPR) repeat protein